LTDLHLDAQGDSDIEIIFTILHQAKLPSLAAAYLHLVTWRSGRVLEGDQDAALTSAKLRERLPSLMEVQVALGRGNACMDSNPHSPRVQAALRLSQLLRVANEMNLLLLVFREYPPGRSISITF
jgi:hypothetical protein